MNRSHWLFIAIALPALAARPATGEPPHAAHLGALAERIRLVSALPQVGPGGGGLDAVVDPVAYRRLWDRGSVVLEAFPLPGRQPVQLELSAFDVVAPGARFLAVDASGEHVVPRPRMRSFRGRVSGDPDSLSVITLFDDRVAGFIRAFGEEFELTPLRGPLPRGSAALNVRNARAGSTRPDPRSCLVDSAPSTASPSKTSLRWGGPIGPETLLQARVAVDATVEWFEEFGSLSAAQIYILSLLSEVSAIYESEFNVELVVPYLRIFTAEPDPYPDGETSSAQLLPIFRSEWNARQAGVSRTVAHLFSAKSSGGNGYAYIDVLCSNDVSPGNSSDYGTTIMAPTGASWETWLVAHELGHNFSSPHTHCYVPEIDRCANESGCYQGPTQQTLGTIMSYCNQTVNVFHERVIGEKLRPAAEEAFPTCIDLAGLPADIRAETGDGLVVSRLPTCPDQALRNDDGAFNNVHGVAGTAQGAFIKRFTPACYPFQLEQIQFLVGESPSIEAGRPIRLLVYTDETGSGDPGLSTLVYSEDTTIQVKSYSVFNQYSLATPVSVGQGDLYIGYQDLVADPQQTTMALRDSSVTGDSWRAISTDPAAFTLLTGGTWMIRGQGGSVPSGSVGLDWGEPCNLGTVPVRDFAVYAGAIGDFTHYESLACTTAGSTSYVAVEPTENRFYLVVPLTNTREGSYGRTSAQDERPAAALPCKVQEIEPCP